MQKTPKQRYCCNCGEEIGIYAGWDKYDTCGMSTCDKEVRDMVAEERSDAHRELDQSMGYYQ